VVATADGTEVTFTAGDYALQLQRWGDILRQLTALAETRTIRSLDLSVRQNSPIRWNEPAEPAAAKDSDAPGRTPRPRPKRQPRRSHA